MRNTLDELEGVSRTKFGGQEQLVYMVGSDGSVVSSGGRLTTGYDDNGLKAITSLRRGFGYVGADGKNWAWRDQLQQSLVRQARRLPYEVPAFYAADKVIGRKIFGHGSDEEESRSEAKWYNPVPLITGFAKDIAKTAAFQMGGFVVPAALGSASTKSSANFFHMADRNIDDIRGVKRAAAESGFFLKGVLQGVGHDIADILGKGIAVSQRSTGALAVGWNELTRARKNPVQELYRQRHGEVDPSVRPPLTKRQRLSGIASTIFGGNNQPLNQNALDEHSLLELIPGYKAVKTSVQQTRQQYRTIKDAQTILNDVTQLDRIVTQGGYTQSSGQFDALSTAIQDIQLKSNSPLTRVNDFLQTYSRGSKDGRVAIQPFRKQVERNVYKDTLRQELINNGVEENAAKSFVSSLKIEKDILFRDLREEGELRVVDAVNRFGIGSDPIHEDDFFNTLISRYNSGRYGQQKPIGIQGDVLQQAISNADAKFLETSTQEFIGKLSQDRWNAVYNAYTTTAGETVYKQPKLLSANYSASVANASQTKQLTDRAAQVLGLSPDDPNLINKLRSVGLRDNNVDDLKKFLIDNKQMTRGSSTGLLGFLGIERTGLKAQYDKEFSTLSQIERKKFQVQGTDDPYALISKDVMVDRGYLATWEKNDIAQYAAKTSPLATFINKLTTEQGSGATISGYYNYGNGLNQSVNLNPLKQYARKVVDFATNEVKTPVVNFNPLRLFAAKDMMQMREAGDFQLISGLTQNPFIRKETADADLIAWFRTGGLLGSKGKVVTFGGSNPAEGTVLAGRYSPISTMYESMISRTAELSAGQGKVKPIHDTSTRTGRIKRMFNYDREQSGSIFQFAGRLLNRRFDINNEAVMGRILADDIDTDFVVGGFGRKKTLRLQKQAGVSDEGVDVARYTLVDAADPNNIVAGHQELMEAFTRFANTTLSQGTGRTVNEAMYVGGPLQGAVARNITSVANPFSVKRAQNVRSIIDDLEGSLNNYNQKVLQMRQGVAEGTATRNQLDEAIEQYEIRKKAFSRLKKYQSMDDIELSSQSSMFDKSPSILSQIDEFQSELMRYLTVDEALIGSDPSQLIANMSKVVDDLVKSGRISQSQKAEAQASILSTVFNLSAFKTYRHTASFTDISGALQTNFSARFDAAKTILNSSDDARALLDPYVKGTIASPRTSKYGGITGRAASVVKRNLAPSKYQFESKVSTLSGDNEYTFVPTFATALQRNPKATLLSAAGIKTYGNEEGFSLASVPMSHGFERLNKYFGTFGAQLNVNSYSGPLSMYGAGMVGQRVLPAVAIGSTALAVDRTAGGLVNERDERGERVYTPLVATGAARLAVEAQSMMSGITPGGMSYSEKKQQLLEGEVAIRQGRFWLLGNTPFKGGKIQYFRPSWYRRLEGAATFTSDTYGSPMEKLAFYNDFSPLRPLDPYRFERKHYQDRPYPLTGEYFSGPFGPVTPILNATVGRILKPQRAMHVEEVTAALGSSQPVGEGGAYIPPQRKLYYGANIQGNALVSYPAAPPPNIPAKPFRHFPVQPYGGSGNFQSILASHNSSYSSQAGATQAASMRVQKQIGSVNEYMGQYPSSGSVLSGQAQLPNVAQATYGIPTGPMIMPSKITHAGMPIRTSSNQYLKGETAYKLQETAGIYGFLGGNVRSAITGGAYDFEPNRAVLQSASKAYGTTRAFWDLNLGGLGDVPLPAEGALGNIEISEVVRRFIPKERTNVDFLNPIKNTMGRRYPFLPGNEYFTDFTRGDPFTKVPEGEMRLPGVGYERFNKLYPDESGRYGAVNQLDILADVAPYSKEYRAINKKIDSMNLSAEERAKVAQVRAQREAIDASKTNFSAYKERSLSDKILNPFETTKDALLHTDNIINNKFIGERTATEDWERKHVYGTTFPEWQNPVESYIQPIFYKGTQRNPILAGVIGGAVFSTMFKGRQAKTAAAIIGGTATGLFSLMNKGKERYIPQERKKQLALEEYADILTYVKYTTAAARAEKAGDVEQAKQFMSMSKKTMYGADLDTQNLDALAVAIPKRKRDHFKAMLQAPEGERSRILSTAGRLERRIYEAAWGMRVEKRPDLVEYFQNRELPGADWEGWHPNTNMEHVKIKMGQSMGLEMSQMGYYPQQIKEANLVNPSYPNFGARMGDAKDVRRRLQQLMNDNNINGRIVPVAGSSNPGSVNISAGVM